MAGDRSSSASRPLSTVSSIWCVASFGYFLSFRFGLTAVSFSFRSIQLFLLELLAFLTCRIFVFPRRPFQIAASSRSWSTRWSTRLNWVTARIDHSIFNCLPNSALSNSLFIIGDADIHTYSTLASIWSSLYPTLGTNLLTNASVDLWSMHMQSVRPRTLPHVPARIHGCHLLLPRHPSPTQPTPLTRQTMTAHGRRLPARCHCQNPALPKQLQAFLAVQRIRKPDEVTGADHLACTRTSPSRRPLTPAQPQPWFHPCGGRGPGEYWEHGLGVFALRTIDCWDAPTCHCRQPVAVELEGA